ncbi:hypothetical protein Y032_0296g1704 [Ancylostoma ceylanicum]|uniref:Uncharacterized protein n=1 Tax=Ancylostoma ceylanicum TaxID=53326 RepID=A0A016S5H3_9BILA|nr:hypothetical protein Y032_0296g1704 [Ancylostoma ceylanicum]
MTVIIIFPLIISPSSIVAMNFGNAPLNSDGCGDLTIWWENQVKDLKGRLVTFAPHVEFMVERKTYMILIIAILSF